ncbi:hypothetical protein MLD38_011053 [Melastoma candidum]|uniref:Uncharacterized protein n=1 Tax=Melastoma candidum TaxID=119954 RepID=A0ACB9R1X5_9MYRT|nr:hypothetical protein MLD38_011053 [Melastoma candidum]
MVIQIPACDEEIFTDGVRRFSVCSMFKCSMRKSVSRVEEAGNGNHIVGWSIRPWGGTSSVSNLLECPLRA